MAGETVKTEATCLRISPWSCTSHVVSWLTPSGRVATLVKGAVRPKSAFLGQYDLNYTCEIVYYARARGDAHALRECFPLERRDDLRGDYAALAVASYFRALADELAPQGPDCRDWHDLVVRSLDALPGAANLVGELLAFELEVLRLMGLWSGVAPEGGSFALRGERRFDVSAAAAKCLAAPRAEKNFASLLDAARAIGVFYTFHVDVAPEARRLALQFAAKTTQERLKEK